MYTCCHIPKHPMVVFDRCTRRMISVWGFTLIIGPESDHWECLSVTNSLTNCRLVNLIDVTLACEDAYSKLAEVVTVA